MRGGWMAISVSPRACTPKLVWLPKFTFINQIWKKARVEKGGSFVLHFQYFESTIKWWRPLNSDLFFLNLKWHYFTWIRLTTFPPSVPIVQKDRSAGTPASIWLQCWEENFCPLRLFLRLNAIPNLISNFNPADVIQSLGWVLSHLFSSFQSCKWPHSSAGGWVVGGWCRAREGCPLGGQAEATTAHLPTTKLDLGQYV